MAPIKTPIASNALNMRLAPGPDLLQVLRILSAYGEVMSLQLCAEDGSPLAEVAFFDARVAPMVASHFSPDHCWPAPAQGDRRVRVPGDMEVDAELWPAISQILSGTGSEMCGSEPCEPARCYTLEFYDVRAAASYRRKVERAPGSAAPPGLALPPGLVLPETPCLTCTAELEPGTAELAPTYQVLITGLPNELLPEPMMTVVLGQAGLAREDVVGFVTQEGTVTKTAGEALVTLGSSMAVDLCAKHFRGCSWDASGATVDCRLRSVNTRAQAAAPPPRLQPAQLQAGTGPGATLMRALAAAGGSPSPRLQGWAGAGQARVVWGDGTTAPTALKLPGLAAKHPTMGSGRQALPDGRRGGKAGSTGAADQAGTSDCETHDGESACSYASSPVTSAHASPSLVCNA